MASLVRVGAALVACAVVLAGCKVDAEITVTLRDDGTGTIDTLITLDSEAVARVETGGRTLESAFPLDDLRASGWTIAPWQRGADGAATLRLQHDYTGEDELDERIAELVGPSRLLRNPELRRSRGLLRSHDELSIAADLRSPSAGISQDPALVAALEGAGVDVATLDQRLQQELRDALSVSVTVEAPGDREQTIQVIAGEQDQVTAARSSFDSGRLVWFVIGAILVFLAILLYLSASMGARRERARDHIARPIEQPPLM